jgi:hypothetical protein
LQTSIRLANFHFKKKDRPFVTVLQHLADKHRRFGKATMQRT